MKHFARSILLATTALLISVGPVWANQCAFFISGYFNGTPTTGFLLGQSRVTVDAGFDYYFNSSISTSFCVGTYRMDGGDGYTYHLQLRCDTYGIWGWF